MANRLKQMREARGLTQPELAEKAGTTKQNIGKLEKKPFLDGRWLDVFTRELDCSVSDLTEDRDGQLELSADEIRLVSQYRSLSSEMQMAIRTIASSRGAAVPAGAPVHRQASMDFLLSGLQEAMELEGLPSLSSGTALRLMATLADRLGFEIIRTPRPAKKGGKAA